MKKFFTTILTILFLPELAFAQFDSTSVSSLITSAHGLINRTIIPLLISAAVLYTIYAVVVFIAETGDSQKKEEKKQQIFWAIIGLFVIVSIWGLVAIVGRTFGTFAGGSISVN